MEFFHLKAQLIDWATDEFLRLNRDGSTKYDFNYDVIKAKASEEGKIAGFSAEDVTKLCVDTEKDLHLVDELEGDMKKLSAIPPKPNMPAGDGFEWAFDSQSKTWVKKTVTSSLVFEKPSPYQIKIQQKHSRIKATLDILHRREQCYNYLEKILASKEVDVPSEVKGLKIRDIVADSAVNCEHLENGDKVSHVASKRNGKVVRAKLDNNAYIVQWNDTNTETICWKQELAKRA